MSIKSKIQSLITAANTKTGESDTTLTDAVQTLVDGYGQGGTTITDGIVIKAKNSDGYPTEVDVYGDVTPVMFAYTSNVYNQHSGWEYLQTINLKTPGCKLYNSCFCWLTNLTTINGAENVIAIYGDTSNGSFCHTNSMVEYNFPNADSFPGQIASRRIFNYCTNLKRIFLPKANGVFGGGFFIIQNCTALELVQMGSIGYTVTRIGPYAFQNCTQTGLTIVIYSVGDNVDQIVTAVRNYATNATIIIKASEATTYNGTSYAAGDTILTSEVT